MTTPSAETHFYLSSELLRDADALLGTLEFYTFVLSPKDLDTLITAVISLIERASEHYLAMMKGEDISEGQRASWNAYLTRVIKSQKSRAEALDEKTRKTPAAAP